MNISGSIKSVGNKVKNAFTGKSYRTGVLNDFSIVSKAAFYILRPDGGNGYTLEEKLPVQINPSEFRHNCMCKVYSLRDATSNSDLKVEELPSSINIPLKFDIYDEYNARTLNGAGALMADVSLMNKQLTSLPKLIENWGKTDTYTFFKWGQMEYFGIISNIDCTYTAFSRWGEPLKCDATVSIAEKEMDLAGGASIISKLGAAGSNIEKAETKSNKITTGLLVASKALR